jgi:hypothetical protein
MEFVFGFAGLTSQSQQFVLAQLRHRLDLRCWEIREHAQARGLCAMTVGDSERQPCLRVAQTDAADLVWTGHVVSPNLPLWPSASRLLQHIEEKPLKALPDLDGLYALAVFDHARKSLCLATDRYNMHPFYFLRAGDGLLFSTSVDLLIWCSPDKLSFNPLAAAELLHFRGFLGYKTLAKGIECVPQGKAVVFNWREGSLSFETYFSYSDLPAPSIRDTSTAVEQLVPALENAVRRRLEHGRQINCLLSGGFDSRTMCGILDRLCVPFHTFTIDSDLGKIDDLYISRLVSQALQAPNTDIPQPPDYLERFWKPKCLSVDFSTTMHAWAMPLAQAPQMSGAVNFDGLAGDVFLRAFVATPETVDLIEKGRLESLTGAVYLEINKAHNIGQAVSSRIDATWERAARESLQKELSSYLGNPNGLFLYDLGNLTRRAVGVNTCQLMSAKLANFAPFLDYQALELGLSIDPKLKFGHELYQALLAALNPALARIPSSNSSRHEWPEDFPRRERERICLQRPAAIESFLDAIDIGAELVPSLVNQQWLANAREAASDGMASRKEILYESMALGELSYWFETYKDRVDMPGAKDLLDV